MKKAVRIAAAVAVSLVVVASLSLAQVKEGTVPPQKTADMTRDISSLMSDMSGMMAKMAEMSKDASPETRKKLSGAMSNLSREMTNMSVMLGGKMGDRELERMHVRLMKTQRILSEMEMKK